MKKQITRLLALVIAIVMAVTVVPVLPAKAAGNLEISIQGNGGVFEYVLSGQTDSTTGCGNEQGTAGKTVVALLFHACIWVLYLFHNFVCIIFASVIDNKIFNGVNAINMLWQIIQRNFQRF